MKRLSLFALSICALLTFSACSTGELPERTPAGRRLSIMTADQSTLSVYESDLAENGILCSEAEVGNTALAFGLLNEQLSAGAAKVPVCYEGRSKSDSDCDYRYIRRPYQVSAPTVTQSQSRFMVCVSISRYGAKGAKSTSSIENSELSSQSAFNFESEPTSNAITEANRNTKKNEGISDLDNISQRRPATNSSKHSPRSRAAKEVFSNPISRENKKAQSPKTRKISGNAKSENNALILPDDVAPAAP